MFDKFMEQINFMSIIWAVFGLASIVIAWIISDAAPTASKLCEYGGIVFFTKVRSGPANTPPAKQPQDPQS